MKATANLLPYNYRALVYEALESELWDWYEDMDGCSFSADYWVCKYSIPCLVHDYLWRTGRGGFWSDVIFHKFMGLFGFGIIKKSRRFLLVRTGWLLYFKWKHKSKGNVNKFSKNALRLINEIKQETVITNLF